MSILESGTVFWYDTSTNCGSYGAMWGWGRIEGLDHFAFGTKCLAEYRLSTVPLPLAVAVVSLWKCQHDEFGDSSSRRLQNLTF